MIALLRLIRKLGQVGLNFSACCSYQKEDRADMVPGKLSPNEYIGEKYYNLLKIILKDQSIWEFALLWKYQLSLEL